MSETTKKFVAIYGIFTVIMLLTQINLGVNVGFNLIEEELVLSPIGLINYGKDIVSFLISLVFFSIPNTDFSGFVFIVNGIIWIFRIIAGIEIVPYLVDLLPFT